MLASELITIIENGTGVPDKSVLIVIDDGYLDNYTIAFPVIQKYGIKVNISVVVSSSEVVDASHPIYPITQNHITQEQMREMEDTGLVEILSHSYNGHQFVNTGEAGDFEEAFYVTNMYLSDECRMETDAEYEARIRADIVQSKVTLEKWLSREVDTFVYPYGRFNDTLLRVLDEEGFRLAITTRGDENTIGELHPLKVNRYNVDYTDNLEEFKQKLG